MTISENADKDEMLSDASIDRGTELTHTFPSLCKDILTFSAHLRTST